MLQLELHENEVQPCIYIATLQQPSNRNVDRITIDFYKAGAKYMLINRSMTCRERSLDQHRLSKIQKMWKSSKLSRNAFASSDQFRDLDRKLRIKS